MISQVSSLLQYHNINIASLNCDRSGKGREASMIISVDGNIHSEIIDNIEEVKNIVYGK